MASATKTFTDAELYAVLLLSKTETIDFTQIEVPAGSYTTMAQAYLDLILARDIEVPFGKTLRTFAAAQAVLIKAAIAG